MAKITVHGGASHAGEVPASDPNSLPVVVEAPADPPVVETPAEPVATPAAEPVEPVTVRAEPDDTSRQSRRRRSL